ncbi:MAG: oligosaccharide flippase family protein [Ruminococcus sp.]|nr:oligosaccharide flippase family protein [Ruminococcus sp.]
MSRESKLAKNTGILAIGTFLPKLASFITLPILTGCMTKEEMGNYDLITVLVSLILPTATLQIQSAAFRFLIDIRKDEKKIKAIVSTILTFIIPVSLAALLILFFVLPGMDPTIKLLICGYYFADILVNAVRQLARGLERNLDYSISAIVSSLFKMIFAVVFVWHLKWGLTGSVIALMGASTLSLVVILIRSKIYRYYDPRSFSTDCLKEMLKYSWPLIPNGMSMWIMRLSDRFVVTLYMGVAVNAVYAVANKIPSLLNLAQSTFTMAWQENATIVSKDDDADKYYSLMFRTMFDLVAGFLGILICATPLLFKLFIRGDYSEAYFQMPVLFIAMFFYSMSSFLGGIYVAYMKTKSIGVTTTAAAVCNLVIDIALIKFIGLYAASGSTLISYMLLFVFRMIDVRKMVKISYSKPHMILILAILLTESVLCFLQKPILNVINIVFGVTVFFWLNKSLVRAVFNKGMKILKKH